MPDGGFGEFLARSFELLACEAREARNLLCGTLAGCDVHIWVDGEPVRLEFEPSTIRLSGARGSACIEVRTSRAAILALLDDRISLDQAILRDALELRGRPADLLRFYDGLIAYVHGAVRAPSFPRLFDAFRATVPEEGEC